MAQQVVDYSVSHPNPALVARSGYVGAMRYLWDAPKGVTADEIAGLDAFHLSVGFVFESTANRAGEGIAAGQADAVEADKRADALGIPGDVPIYYAVDFQATALSVSNYFDGVRLRAKRPVGIYGHYDLIEYFCGAGGIAYGWQCAAWSGNGSGTGGSLDGRRVSQHARLFQHVGYVLGNTCDFNEVLNPDWGQYPRPNVAPPVPQPLGVDVQDVRFIRVDGDPAVYLTNGAGGDPHHVASLPAARYMIQNSPNTKLLPPPTGANTDAPASPDVWVVKKGDWTP